MEGRVLEFDEKTGQGLIKGKDENRYNFTTQDWPVSTNPTFNTLVDFEIDENSARHIVILRDKDAEDTAMLLGVLSLVITLFLAFFGTMISRLAISKQPASKAFPAIAMHFVVTLVGLIPAIGWILYFAGTAFFMIRNFQLVKSRPA
jgi:hypothetical protein